MFGSTALQKAHKHSAEHREETLKSEKCGCFHCKKIFSPANIQEWVDYDYKGIGQTALCPICGEDAVLDDKSGFPITREFLAAINSFWF
jgi:hypothetical protein